MQTQSLTRIVGAGDVKFVGVGQPDTVPLSAAYKLSPEQASFFKRETGIDNDDDLKAHILNVQERAYEIFRYPCIKWFTFLQPGIVTLPVYESIIKLGQEHPDGILLDIGCCFAVDARRAVADGFPLKNVVTSDLKKEFFGVAHALFNTTHETYPISFVPGDAFDPNMLQIVPPFDKLPSTKRPDLSTLTSLNPLAGHCVVIYASNFFHLFSEENQLHLAKALAGLLSFKSGSIICGEHVGGHQKGMMQRDISGKRLEMFQHSPESWSALWDDIFPKGSVKVNMQLGQFGAVDNSGHEFLQLKWSVVRL